MVTKDEIKAKVSTDRRYAERAIVVIFERQTSDEQSSECTTHKNGVGFSAFDAEILSSFAKQLLSGRHLSEKQLAIAFKKMPYYSRQLFEAAVTKSKEQGVLQ